MGRARQSFQAVADEMNQSLSPLGHHVRLLLTRGALGLRRLLPCRTSSKKTQCIRDVSVVRTHFCTPLGLGISRHGKHCAA